MARGRGWKLTSLSIYTPACRATALLLSLYENRSPQTKGSFPFFTSLHFFFFFFHYLQSQSPSLVACPCFLPVRQLILLGLGFFFSILFAATTILALFLIQPKAYSSFLRSPRKILPILPHCYMVSSGSALPHYRGK